MVRKRRSFYTILRSLDMVKFALVAIVLFFLGGCAPANTNSTFSRENTDLGYITKVAVLPFYNNTKDEFAASRIRGIITTEILSQNLFDVVERGVVDSTLREMAIDQSTPIDSPVLKRLGQRLGVQAFVHGSVDDISVQRLGAFTYPQVTLTLRLIDSEVSMVLWQSSAHRSGYSVWDRLFDLDPQDGFEITLALVREMLESIPK